MSLKEHEQLCADDLSRIAEASGSGYRLVAPPMKRDELVLSGRVLSMECRSGLRVHSTDARELHDMSMRITLRPCVSIFLVLDGQVEGAFGASPLKVEARPGVAAGQIWAKTEPTPLVRYSRRGTHVRKVAISAPLDWFTGEAFEDVATETAMQRFAANHLSSLSWTPSAQARALAEQIVHAADAPPWRRELEIESRAIGIAAEAMGAIAGTAPREVRTMRDSRDALRAQRARGYIEAHLDDALSLDAIARECGASVAALQRAFKRTYGTSVIDFVRRVRLEAARMAIESDGVSIAEAAWRAGYSTSSAFSTAFKREFGVPPTLLRR